MKAIAKADKRSDAACQKADDAFKQKVFDLFRANPRQAVIFSNLLADYVQEKVREATESTALAYSLALIDLEHFGTGEKATRLLRCEKYAIEAINEAYGHEAVDANGHVCYDGCGQEYLKNKLKNRGVIFMKEEK